MAVIDADEEAVGVIVAGDRLAQLRRVDLISRFGCRVNVSSAHQSSHHFAIAEEQTTTFAGRGLARVRNDLLPDLSRQDMRPLPDTGALPDMPAGEQEDPGDTPPPSM